MIDWRRIDELQAEIGPDGFAEVVELFLEEVEEVVTRLRMAPDPARFAADMHFLKGGAWNLGFTVFGNLCDDVEKKAAAGKPDEIDLFRILDSYFASKEAFLISLADRNGTTA